eukprot:727253_1
MCHIFQILLSLILFHLISLTLSQNSTNSPQQEEVIYGHCGTQFTDEFVFLDDGKRPFCFKFKNAATGGEPYTSFYYFGTRVDIYTLVTVSGSNLGEQVAGNNSLNWLSRADVGVQFEAGNKTTKTMLARKYDAEEDTAWVFTQLSVVIILDQGHVDEVIWDTGCYSCDAAHCIKGNCAINQDDCQAGTNKCDFSAYVSWYGTDGTGRYLLSAGQRLSQFQSVSAKSYYDYVRNNLDTDVVIFGEFAD